MKLYKTKIILFLCVFMYSSALISQNNSHSLNFKKTNYNFLRPSIILQDDTAKKDLKTQRNISISGIFLSIGTGLSVPVAEFSSKSNAVFGILGRLEYSSTSIFPVVIGGEVSYFSYSGSDNFMTQLLLTTYQTKVLSAGLTVEVTFSRLLNSSYTIPFICLDFKSNSIKRDVAGTNSLLNIPTKETKYSIGAGFGFTLFVLDFYLKYNYMKDLSSIGLFTKIKFPILRF